MTGALLNASKVDQKLFAGWSYRHLMPDAWKAYGKRKVDIAPILMSDRPVDHVFHIESAAAWHADMQAAGFLPFWVVHYNTARYPHIYHARAWTVPAHGNGAIVQPVAYTGILVAPTLDALRGLLPSGLVHIDRAKDDPWDVVERWIS